LKTAASTNIGSSLSKLKLNTQASKNYKNLMTSERTNEDLSNLGSIEKSLANSKFRFTSQDEQKHPSIKHSVSLGHNQREALKSGSILSEKINTAVNTPKISKFETIPKIQDNSDLEVIHPCDDFMAILASTLAKLDYSLSHPNIGENIKDSKDLRKLKHSYKKFASRFIKVGQIRNSVFVYSLALARKVKDVAAKKFAFNMGEFLLIYAGCLFLSIKMVVDTEKWFVEDFSTVSGIDQPTIEKMELFVLEDALNFDVSIDRNVYREEHLRTYKNINRRIFKQNKASH
jgi:hypothetical protein